MKTTSTNRKEKQSNLIGIKSGMMGVMMTVLMTSTISFAQRSNEVNTISTEQTEAVERNPIVTQPAKTVVTVIPSIPVCPTISGFNMVDKSYNKVMLGWNNSATFDSIIIRYSLTGTMSYREVALSGSPNTGFYILQGLDPQTTYDFEISSKCFTGAISHWSAPLTITTFAEPAPRFAQNNQSNQRNSIALTINPNPATTTTNVSFVAPVNSVHHISIITAAGREVYKANETCTFGKVQFTFNVTNLSPGLYYVRVYSGTSMSVERLIVL